MADLFNVFNITPHCFDKELNPSTDQRLFYRSVRGRVLPCEDKKCPYPYTPLYGAFCYGYTEEKYNELHLDYSDEYLNFIRKLLDRDRMIFISEDNLKTENDFINSKEVTVDGTICSEDTFKNEECLANQKITSTWHIAEEQTPEWWGHNEDHRIPITYMDLVPYLRNFLKFAPIVQIWDTHILKKQYKKNFHLFMNLIGSANKKVEVEINVERNKISDLGEKLYDHLIQNEVYDKFRDWFKEPQFNLSGISKVTVLIWDDAHDRYIVSSKLGGFNLGKGPQEEGPPKKGKKIKTQSVTHMSPVQVEDLEDDYDEGGLGKRKFYEKDLVFP